jgi:hypothetical protein
MLQLLFKKANNRLLFSAFISFALLLAARPAQAQDPQGPRLSDANFNTWLMFFSDARLTDRWGVHTEAQWRRARGVKSPMQDFGRVGINYHVNDKVMLTSGYAYALTYPYGDFPAAEKFPEHRIYEQLLLRSAHGPFQLSHRYRLEQRWLRRPLQTDYTYLNRTRYQFRAVLPLARAAEGLTPRTPYLAAYDEVFVSFGKNVTRNVFDQNRAYAAFGYQFTKPLSLELGYLYQIVAQGNGVVFEHNHTLQVGLNFNPDFRPNAQTPPAP